MSPGSGGGAAGGRDGGRSLRVLGVCGSAAGGVRSHVLECARLLAADRHDVVLLAPEQVLAGADAGGARTGVLRIGARPSPGDAGGPTSSTPTACGPGPWPRWPWAGAGPAGRAWWSPSTTCPSGGG